jgi:hypothetical protein
MKRLYILLVFVILAVVQIAVPAQMIFNRESILKSGTSYKFKTEPVDPSDPFKGKYIYLNYELDHIMMDDKDWKRNQHIYISISNDSLGFVKATAAHLEPPKSGDFISAKVDWYNDYDSALYFTVPFTEFYMDEYKAYDAEVAHREAQRDSLPNATYALVYVMEGEAVLDNVFINNIPIAIFVEQ